jgi:rhodanese-related sulfurtransferase
MTREVPLAELAALLDRAEPVLVLDVRKAEEYAERHVPGAVHLPGDALPNELDRLPRDRPIVTVCAKGGGRSERAATLLHDAGFPNVGYLQGGTTGWFDRRP